MRSLRFTLAALVLLVLPLGAQQGVFRGGVRTVPVYATVRDEAGRLVPGLTRADFQIFDDGKPAAITTFSNDVLPASISLMLDMSLSMLGEHARVRDSALQFVDALLPADLVRIGTFGDEIAISPWLTSDKATLSRILREEVWPGGETPLWSAMRAGMASLGDNTTRRVIVMLSDGIDTGCPRMIGADASFPDDGRQPRTTFVSIGRRSPVPDDVRQRWTTSVSSGRRSSGPDDVRQNRTTFARSGRRASARADVAQISVPQTSGPRTLAPSDQAARCATLIDVQKLALEGEFMVYAIGMEGPGLTGGLIRLAEDTGGGRFELKRNADLTAAFTGVLDELHHQYALGFTPVALDGRTHQLEVRLARRGMTARARKSYLAIDR